VKSLSGNTSEHKSTDCYITPIQVKLQGKIFYSQTTEVIFNQKSRGTTVKISHSTSKNLVATKESIFPNTPVMKLSPPILPLPISYLSSCYTFPHLLLSYPLSSAGQKTP
jgi:hypothetical protein